MHCSQTFPKPWSVTKFISILLEKLAHPLVGYDIKADLCRVIQKLMKYHDARNKDDIYEAVITLLTGSPTLSSRVPYEKSLVGQALNLLFFLDRLDHDFAVLLMLHFAEGEEEMKKDVMAFLLRQGLKDPLGYLTSGMLKMGKGKKGKGEESGLTPPTTKDVFSRSQEWMVHWTEEFHTSNLSRSLHSLKPNKYVKTCVPFLCRLGFLEIRALVFSPISTSTYFQNIIILYFVL